MLQSICNEDHVKWTSRHATPALNDKNSVSFSLWLTELHSSQKCTVFLLEGFSINKNKITCQILGNPVLRETSGRKMIGGKVLVCKGFKNIG